MYGEQKYWKIESDERPSQQKEHSKHQQKNNFGVKFCYIFLHIACWCSAHILVVSSPREEGYERASGAFLKTVGVDDDAVRKGIWHAKLLQTSYYSYLSHIYTFSTALLAVCWRLERNNNKIDNRVKDVWECWRWWWRAGWKGAKKSWRARKKIRRNTPNSNIYERFFSEQRMLVSTYIYVWQKFNFKFIFLCHIFPFHFSHPRSSRRSETHFSYQNVLVYC